MNLSFRSLCAAAISVLILCTCTFTAYAESGPRGPKPLFIFELLPNGALTMRPKNISVTHQFECVDAVAAHAAVQAFYTGGAVRLWMLIGIAAQRETSHTRKLKMGSCRVWPLKKPRTVERVGVISGKKALRAGIKYPVFSVLVPDFPRGLDGTAEPRAVEESTSEPGPG